MATDGAKILSRLKPVVDEDRLAGSGFKDGEQTTLSSVCAPHRLEVARNAG